MNNSTAAQRSDVARVLEAAGYELQSRILADSEAIVATTLYALIGCIEFGDWADLYSRVFDVQASLTEVAEEAPSARNWDLYLIVLVSQPASTAEQRALAEAIEGDTRYARKFVHAGISINALDRALRPLLPLRPPADIEITDPVEELRNELLTGGVDETTVERSLDSFERTNEVQLT